MQFSLVSHTSIRLGKKEVAVLGCEPQFLVLCQVNFQVSLNPEVLLFCSLPYPCPLHGLWPFGANPRLACMNSESIQKAAGLRDFSRTSRVVQAQPGYTVCVLLSLRNVLLRSENLPLWAFISLSVKGNHIILHSFVEKFAHFFHKYLLKAC